MFLVITLVAPGVEEVIGIMVGLGEGRENREKGEMKGNKKVREWDEKEKEWKEERNLKGKVI